jgi:hypothetical protein
MATMKEVSAVVKVLQERWPKLSLKDACEVACNSLEAVEEARQK